MVDANFTIDALVRDRGVTHSFLSSKSDGGDSTKVQPSNWNGHHRMSGFFLHSEKASAGTLDDEFNAQTLDAKWTVIAGSHARIDLLEGNNVARYDLVTRTGCLLIQVGSAATQEVQLRQDYTLADGESVILAISPAMHLGSVTADELQIGLGLNSDDSFYSAGSTHFEFYAVETDSTPDIQASPTGHSGGQGSVTVTLTNAISRTLFLRMSRSSLFYHPSFSFDGMSWSPLGGSSFAAAHNNLWIFARNAGTTGTPIPVQAIHWIRSGVNSVDPWPWY